MARQRTIVGIGESVLVEHPDRVEPAGLAARIALAAVALGHKGVALSRIGQDQAGEELRRLLNEKGVDTSCFQHDPDLPTARSIVRPLGDRIERHLEDRAAFDNLQSDFDLEDVAHQADAVVYGLLTRRGGQTRSEEDRFIAQCKAAVKVFDLVNRGDEEPRRNRIESGLNFADGVIVDAPALHSILPAASGDLSAGDVRTLMRQAHLSFVITVTPASGDQLEISLHSGEEAHVETIPHDMLNAATVGLLAGVLRGAAMRDALKSGADIARWISTHPDDAVPDHLHG
jgi:sugar/nucleoside kinase (ribokinase family)